MLKDKNGETKMTKESLNQTIDKRRLANAVNIFWAMVSHTGSSESLVKAVLEADDRFRLNNPQPINTSVNEDILVIINVAGDIDIGYFQKPNESKPTMRGNIGGIVSRACDRLEIALSQARAAANTSVGSAQIGPGQTTLCQKCMQTNDNCVCSTKASDYIGESCHDYRR